MHENEIEAIRNPDIGKSWNEILKAYFESDDYKKLCNFLTNEYSSHIIYPSAHEVFNALKETAYESVRVVILGQDPYYNPGQAHGMCFSVKPGVKTPKSLTNIFREIENETGIKNKSPFLAPWARQGVLLLNEVMTVRSGQAYSHNGKGWEIFTDRIISKLNERTEPIVFLLWGKKAQKKETLITARQHKVLKSAHPSPLSAGKGFFGCGHFFKCNEFLSKCGFSPIDWRTDEESSVQKNAF